MDDQNKGYAYLLAASLIAGSIGIIVRSIAGLDAPSILFARAAIASTFLLAAVFVCGRIKNLKVIEPANTLKLGIFYGTSTLLSFEAILHTSISNAYLLLYTAPLF